MDRPVLRYFGGKWKLAPWIISFFPKHEIYIEPFGGAASVLIQKPRSKAEVYNDVDEDTVNVFRVYRDPILAKALIAGLEKTPFARAELTLACRHDTDDQVERARRTIVRSFQGFASATGHKNPGFRCATSTQNTTAAADWTSYVAQAEAFIERFKGVTIECVPALSLLGRYDTPQTLYYLDPPYTHDSRISGNSQYRHEMSNEEHAKMIGVIRDLKGFVIISGYDNPLYDSLGWKRETISHYANGNNSEMRKRTEVIWLNPVAEKSQLQQSLFGGA